MELAPPFKGQSSDESIMFAKVPSEVGCRDEHTVKMSACGADIACVESVRATKKTAPDVSSNLEAFMARDVKTLFGGLDV